MNTSLQILAHYRFVSYLDFDELLISFLEPLPLLKIFLSVIHLAHPYFEKWYTIVNRYLYFLLINKFEKWTISICHLSKGLLILIWCVIVPFLIFLELIWQTWHLFTNLLTYWYILSHLYPNFIIKLQVGWILRWPPDFVWHSCIIFGTWHSKDIINHSAIEFLSLLYIDSDLLLNLNASLSSSLFF